MKKIVIGLIVWSGISLGALQHAQAERWMAVAASAVDYGWGEGYTEEEAKADARRNCGAEPCTITTAVRTDVRPPWVIVLVNCNEGTFMTAGSRRGVESAAAYAAEKLNIKGNWQDSCSIVQFWPQAE